MTNRVLIGALLAATALPAAAQVAKPPALTATSRPPVPEALAGAPMQGRDRVGRLGASLGAQLPTLCDDVFSLVPSRFQERIWGRHA